MDLDAALEKIRVTKALIDKYDDRQDDRALDEQIQMELIVCRAIARRSGCNSLAPKLMLVEQPFFHHWARASRAIVELEGRLSKAAEIEAIVGPAGPELSASSLHPIVWDAAAGLWDDGHPVQAIQTAATALESMMQGKLQRRDVGGEKLAGAFSVKPPDGAWPRKLRLPDIPDDGTTWVSAHEGAAALVRGAAQYIRNLASHPSPDPSDDEALEQLAVLSLVARLVDRAELVTVPAGDGGHS